MPTESDLVGPGEVCRILKIHPSTLARWVTSGKITPAHQLPAHGRAHAGVRLFRRTDIEALAAEQDAS